ncbi:MAG: DUF2683 family protein [Candidatus ainarchaeum sp.]|jgi:hypothetical protein|nr:DUF2683 family protein [Candidatus ainarchaeum sp.]
MIDARVKLNNYTNRVLGVIKAKYDLKDKTQALNKFVEIYGVNEVEPEIDSKYLDKLDVIEKNHFKKKRLTKMSVSKLDEMFSK